PYGRVIIGGLTIHAYLDKSFAFLAEKYSGQVPDWVRTAGERSAFAAGYIDAEGSFGVYEGRARFKLDAYDAHVLAWLDEWCQDIGVRSRLNRVALAGQERAGPAPYRQDLWRVNVNDGPSVLRLIATLDPYVRHAGR